MTVLTKMARTFNSPRTSIALDRTFHTTIAGIIENSALNRFVGELFDQRMTPYFEKLASYFESPLPGARHSRSTGPFATLSLRAIRRAPRKRCEYHLQQSQLRFSKSFDEDLESEKGHPARGRSRNSKI